MNKEETAQINNLQNFFLNSSVDISLTSFVLSIILSAFLAYFIKITFIKNSKTLSNKLYFSDQFIPLATITCLVITVIKFSLALSLGLVGALSIVRFRAAIKEPEELVYLFFVIGIGLACGANQYLIAIFATATISIIIFLLNYNKLNFFKSSKASYSEINVIQIITKKNKEQNNHIFEIIEKLKEFTTYIKLKSSYINKEQNTYILWVEFHSNDSYKKMLEYVSNFEDDTIEFSFTSSESIYE